MMKRMRNLAAAYRGFFTRERRRALYVALLFLSLSLIFQYYASAYSVRTAGHFVGDIFLDNFPVVDLTPIIVEGALFAVVASVVLLFLKPRYLIFGA